MLRTKGIWNKGFTVSVILYSFLTLLHKKRMVRKLVFMDGEKNASLFHHDSFVIVEQALVSPKFFYVHI